MGEAEVFNTFTQIGGVLGTGASLVLFWMYNEIRTLHSEVKVLKKKNEETDKTLTEIRVDVSWMRGNMEGKEDGKSATNK